MGHAMVGWSVREYLGEVVRNQAHVSEARRGAPSVVRFEMWATRQAMVVWSVREYLGEAVRDQAYVSSETGGTQSFGALRRGPPATQSCGGLRCGPPAINYTVCSITKRST